MRLHITVEMAKRVRRRGLVIPFDPKITYETDQLKAIAEEQQSLTRRHEALDKELFSLGAQDEQSSDN